MGADALGRRPRKLMGNANGKHDRLQGGILTEQSEGVIENKGPAPKNKPETKGRTAGHEGTRLPAVSGRQKAVGSRREAERKLMADG
jgi:hypothetical protein